MIIDIMLEEDKEKADTHNNYIIYDCMVSTLYKLNITTEEEEHNMFVGINSEYLMRMF